MCVKIINMKKQKLLLLLPFLVLTACGKTEDTSSNPGEETQEQQSAGGSQTGEGTQTGGGTQGGGTSGGGSQTGEGGTSGGGGQTGGGGGQTTKEYDYDVPTNDPYSLSEYTTFQFHNGREPDFHEDWNFYYGDSFEPNGQLWTNPNEKSSNSGIEFKKNSFIVSPVFESWQKVEVRFDFWFSSHQSDNFKAVKNEPQFKIECYNAQETKLETIDIEIERKDVPSNNTCLQVTKYIRQPDCNHFILRWNNYIPNSQGGYSAILVNSTLRGWPYSN